MSEKNKKMTFKYMFYFIRYLQCMKLCPPPLKKNFWKKSIYNNHKKFYFYQGKRGSCFKQASNASDSMFNEDIKMGKITKSLS